MNTYTFSGPFFRNYLDFTEARVAVASAGPYARLHLAPDR